MADTTSALRDHLSSGRFGRPGPAGVVLSEIRRFALTQIAAWPETAAATGADVARAAGCHAAPGPGQMAAGPKATLLRVEPLKWWLIEQTASEIQLRLPIQAGAVLDLSDSRTWIHLDGSAAGPLLSHFLPLDLREAAFPCGAVASSAFHHVGVTLWRVRSGFNLLLPRSFAASLWELLIASAEQYGLEVTKGKLSAAMEDQNETEYVLG
jgi:heterotetrameric sarcosine oxidase gamma subunit